MTLAVLFMSASRARLTNLVGGLLALTDVTSPRLQGRYLDVAPSGDRTGRVLALEGVERCAHHIIWVGRAERFRHHILHAERLEDGPHRAASDDTGPGRRRPQVYPACTMATGHIVVQGAAFAQRHADEAALSGIGGFADRLGDLARLAVAEADPPLLVANHHERSKAEAAPAFHHLGHAVDVDELVREFAFALFALAAFAWFTCHDFVPTCYPLLLSEHKRLLSDPALRCVRPSALQKSSPPSRAASANALTRPW